MNKWITLLLALSFCNSLAQGNQQFEKGTFHSLPYRILWPENLNQSEKYPVVLFLHGAGERGNDNEMQLAHGSKLFSDSISNYPSIIIFPQCPSDDYWSNVEIDKDQNGNRNFIFQEDGTPTRSMQLVMDLMDSIRQLEVVDQNRFYVLGLSMGGMGTFELLNHRPTMFAAGVSICGGANPAIAKNFANNASLWVFHGGKDDVVPFKYSQEMVDAIKREGGLVKFTLFPEANHNSWDSTFAQPDLLKWLYSQKKKL
jgi:predicted peptidase